MPDRLTPAGRTTTTAPATTMSARNRARVAFATLCAALSDWAVMAVPTRTDHHDSPLAAIETARRGKTLCQTMQFYAVVKALEEGRTWDEIAEACRLPDAEAAKVIYEKKYQAFVKGDPDPWTPDGMRSAIPPALRDHLDNEAGAAWLDEWFIERSHGDGSLVPGLRPVTDGLY